MDAEQERAVRFFERGDRRAYEEIVQRHARFVYNIALGVLHDRGHAEDATQETFLTLLRGSASFEPTGSFRGFIGKIAFHTSLNALQSVKARRRRETLAAQGRAMEERSMSASEEAQTKEVREQVRRLPLQLRIPLSMKYFQKATTREIAEVVGVSKSTVSNRLTEAKERLKTSLAQMGLASLVPSLDMTLGAIEAEEVSAVLLKSLNALTAKGVAVAVAKTGFLSTGPKVGVAVAVVLLAVLSTVVYIVATAPSPSAASFLSVTKADQPAKTARERNPEQERGAPPAALEAKSSEPSPAPGGIAGRVMHAVTQKPVPGAKALLTFPSQNADTIEIPESGAFRMQGVAAGSGYRLTVEAQGFRTWESAGLTVPAGRVLDLGEIQLDPLPPVLQVRVSDAWTRPVPSAKVRLVRQRTYRPRDHAAWLHAICPPEEVVWKGSTGPNGTVDVISNRIPDGAYVLRASSPGLGTANVQGIKVSEGLADRNVHVALQTAVSLWGKVLDEKDRPLEGAWVRAAKSEDGFYYARTDMFGTFRFADLLWTRYKLVAGAQGRSTVETQWFEVPFWVPPEGIVLRLEKGFTVQGKVLDASTGEPVPGATVGALQMKHGQVVDRTTCRGVYGGMAGIGTDATGYGRTRTDVEGNFVIMSLAPGTYRVLAHAPGCDPTHETATGKSGQTVNLELTLQQGLTITGRVIEKGTGRPVPDARVEVKVRDERFAMGGGKVVAHAGPDGFYTLRGVPVTMYRLPKPKREDAPIQTDSEALRKKIEKKARDRYLAAMKEWEKTTECRRVVIAAYRIGFFRLKGKTEEVALGTQRLSNVDLTLTPMQKVSGLVVDAGQRPVTGAEIRMKLILERDSKRGIRSLWTNYAELLWNLRESEHRAFTDNEGRFSLPVYPGTAHNVWAFHKDFAYGYLFVEKVKPNDNLSGKRIVLHKGGRIEGVITDAKGSPVPFRAISYLYLGQGKRQNSIVLADRDKYFTPVYTDKGGRFAMSKLREGTWEVQAYSLRTQKKLTRRVEVREGETAQMAFQLGTTVGIRGTVTDAGGKPLRQVLVDLGGKDVFERVWTDAKGRFTVLGLEEGARYNLNIWGPEVCSKRMKDVPAGTEDLQVVLQRAEVVKGRLVDSEGRPVYKGSVRLVSDTGHTQLTTGPNGGFYFPRLKPGWYKIIAWSPNHKRQTSGPVRSGGPERRVMLEKERKR
jgi:RNA polymerase sigma-70 factor (ECF subfamily)